MRESINRGYNLMVTVVLAVSGLAFGADVGGEAEWADKADDLALLLIGVIAVIWYNWAGQRYERVWTPVVLTGLALVAQIVGLAIEHGDSAAVGDNIGGVVLFSTFFVYALVQRAIDRGIQERLSARDTTEGRSSS